MATAATEDYLKTIFTLSRAGEPAGTSAIAESLGVAAGSVSGMLRRLADRGLVEHVRYYGARLTADGEAAALRIIRRHRILELFMVEVLGYGWDGVHMEAERLEHAVSDELIARMAGVLGEPTADPHGAPIPTVEGRLEERIWPCLEELESGDAGVVRRVSDADPAVLRRLAGLGLRPGVSLRVVSQAAYAGPLHLEIKGTERVVGRELARTIRVEPAQPAGREESR